MITCELRSQTTIETESAGLWVINDDTRTFNNDCYKVEAAIVAKWLRKVFCTKMLEELERELTALLKRIPTDDDL